jgi:hypothetical protein
MVKENLPPAFDDLFQKFLDLHKEIALGQINTQDFQAELENLTLTDQYGGDWRLSKDGNWYFNNGIEWVQRDPQILFPAPHNETPEVSQTPEVTITSPEIEQSPKVLEKTLPHKPSGKRKLKWFYIVIPILIIICCLCVVIFWYFGDGSNTFIDENLPDVKVTQSEAQDSISDPENFNSDTLDGKKNEVQLSEQHKSVVDDLGWPDAFTLVEMDNVQGEPIRHEIWNYYLAQTSFLFSNGIFISDSEVEMPPAGIIPTPYTPDQFPVGISLEDIQTLLGDVSLNAVENSDLIQEGFQLYAGQQILLGFINNQLVYVEALALFPEGSE